MIPRREFITLLGAAGAAWPVAARAQPTSRALRVGTASAFPKIFPLWLEFKQRLRELGYFEGQNLLFEFLELGNQINQYVAATAAMQELVRRKVDIIVDAGEEISL